MNTADAAAARRRATAEEHEAGAGEKTAAGAAATSSEGEPTAGPASTALARLLLLAVILAAWQAAMVQVMAVARELNELRTRVASLVPPPVERERATVTAAVEQLAHDGDPPPADERHDAEAGADVDPTIGLTEAFDLPRVELSVLTCAQGEADLIVGPEPPLPPPPRAYFEVAGFLAWSTWFGSTSRSFGGLMPLEHDDDEGRDWFGNVYCVYATPSMPPGPLVLGILGARGPPRPWR